MKKTDIAMIILIASLAVLAAFFIANSLPFLKVDEKGVQVDTIEKISDNVVDPDPKLFNESAINPTVETVIGDQAAAPR